MRETRSSGTSGIARCTCSLVAGQPSIDWICWTTSGLTPLALGNVRLLPQVLREKLTCAVERGLLVLVHRADDQLRAVDIVEAAAGAFRAGLQPFQRHGVVFRRHTVVEHGPVGDLSGQLHHPGAGGADHDRHVAGLLAAVHDIQLDAADLVKFTGEAHVLHREQATRQLHRFAHGFQRSASVDANVFCQGGPTTLRCRR